MFGLIGLASPIKVSIDTLRVYSRTWREQAFLVGTQREISREYDKLCVKRMLQIQLLFTLLQTLPGRLVLSGHCLQ